MTAIVGLLCCCDGGCANAWGACDATLKIEVLGMNLRRYGSACDSGSLNCTGWQGLTIIDDLTASISELEFEYVPPALSIPGHYEVKPAVSNGGFLTVGLSVAGDQHPYKTTESGSCSSDWTPNGSGSFSNALDTLDPDQTVDELTGSIYSELWWTGTAWECRFVLRLFMTVSYSDRYDYNYLERIAGNGAAEVNTSAKMTFTLDLVATAPYSATACPDEQPWTIQSMSYALLLDDVNVGLSSGVPEPAKFTDCPEGASLDCTVGFETPDDCFFALGYDSAMLPYLPGGLWEASGFVLWSNDTPSLSVTA